MIAWRNPGPGAPEAPFVSPSPLPAPFPMPAAGATAFDDESRVTSLSTDLAPYATTSTRLVPDLFNPGTKFGWASLDLNVGSAPADARQSWVTVTHTWEGRFSTATNGVALDPPMPRLQVVSVSCPGGTSYELTDPGWGFLAVSLANQGCNARNISYRLRLIDTQPRTVRGVVSQGTWAGLAPDTPGTDKTVTVSPGEFDTSDVWGFHENAFGFLDLSVPGGSPAQFIRLYIN